MVSLCVLGACSSSAKVADSPTSVVEVTVALPTASTGPLTTVAATTPPPTTTTASTTTEAATTTVAPSTTDPASTTTLVCDSDSHAIDRGGVRICQSNNGSAPPPVTTASVPLGPAFAPEDIASVLARPLSAWMLKPSGARFDAVSTAAQSLIDADREFPEVDFGARAERDFEVRGIMRSLAAYPGSDLTVYKGAEVLAGYMPGQLPAIIDDGNYTVGVDVQPGTYRTVDSVEGCYWETLNSAGATNRNNFVNAAPQVMMVVRSSDYAMNSDGCGPWVRTGN
jgi:hypothetical protein